MHLAAVIGPLLDEPLFTRVNVDGTRRVLEAATAAGVHKFVRPSSIAVYGAWANNPVPITEDAPLRPSPGYLPAIVDAECERLLAAVGRRPRRPRRDPAPHRARARRRRRFVVRSASRPVTLPVRVRGAAPPVQIVHVDDAAAALELATTNDLDGAYNVAADGWLEAEEARALLPVPRAVVPASRPSSRTRRSRQHGPSGSATRRPSVLPVSSCTRGSSRTTA